MNLENIIAVIVLYNSSLDDSESFKSLLKSVEHHNIVLTLVVYNNSPQYWGYNHEQYQGLNLIYVADQLNSGVSKAYNTGFEYAKRSGSSFILLLDQDTLLSQHFFDVFIHDENAYRNSGVKLFCPMMMNSKKLLSPAKFFLFKSIELSFIRPGINQLKGLAIINSGLIISTDLFELAGGYNEKIKLDFSDFDFLKRSEKFTKEIIVLNTKCLHKLSAEGEVTLESALNRFGYYINGGIYYKKSFFEAIGLGIWAFLRSVKLNIRYKTFSFTKMIFISILKI